MIENRFWSEPGILGVGQGEPFDHKYDPRMHIAPYSFINSDLEADGSVLQLEPFASSTLLKVVKPFDFIDVITRGDGYMLSADSRGQIRFRRLIAGRDLEPIRYRIGDITIYLAKEKGMTITEVNIPKWPVDESVKVEIPVTPDDENGKLLPPEFWHVHRVLMAIQKRGLENK